MGDTLVNLRTEVLYRIARDGESGLEDRIDKRINWSIQSLVQQIYLSAVEETFTRSLLTNNTYVLPTDCLILMSLKVREDRQPVRLINLRQQETADETTVGGPPQFALRYSNYIIIHPTPSTTYLTSTKTLVGRYIKEPPLLSADADMSILPEYCDELIVMGAAYRMLRDLNEPQRAMAALNDWRAMLRTVRIQRGEELQWAGGNLLGRIMMLPR